MADEEFLAVLRKGVHTWNEWRARHPEIRGADLSGADLSGADLSGADLSEADLSEADLSEANLSDALLEGADLTGAHLGNSHLMGADLIGAHLGKADLTGADLTGANLTGADLTGADLTGADLFSAGLIGARLNGADVSEATLYGTVFGNVDLSVAKGLTTVEHSGPSTIGIDTIYKSGGNIPEVFLRGAGVPDNFITYVRSLVGKPIEFYSCFISYSTKDQEFAELIFKDLQHKGVRCWFATHDIAAGKKIHEQIDEAIRLHDRVLLILSRASMRSEWVKTEIATARRREQKEKRRVLFPVALVSFKALKEWKAFDADIGKDSAREVREYFIPDFSQWKDHDSYQQAFERLLRDFKIETRKA